MSRGVSLLGAAGLLTQAGGLPLKKQKEKVERTETLVKPNKPPILTQSPMQEKDIRLSGCFCFILANISLCKDSWGERGRGATNQRTLDTPNERELVSK